jgi:cation:H+ antiporter
VEFGVFALSAIVSLTASVILVTRLERVGERIGASEALLGLIAALAADGPEITSSVTAIAGGHGTVGVGVALGSNVFNLAALLGLSALIAGRIALHRRSILLEGGVGLLIALLGLTMVAGAIPAPVGLLLAIVIFVPYVTYSAVRPAGRPLIRLPYGLSSWLERALAEEELELAHAIRPRRGDGRDALVALGALAVVILASVAMEESATTFGAAAGLAPIIVGGLILAAVTSLPNAVAAIYLAWKGRGAAVLSTASNSNAINVIVGLMLPAVILGIGGPTSVGGFVALFYLGLTALAMALALHGKGLNRWTGSVIIAAYVVFVAVLLTS